MEMNPRELREKEDKEKINKFKKEVQKLIKKHTKAGNDRQTSEAYAYSEIRPKAAAVLGYIPSGFWKGKA